MCETAEISYIDSTLVKQYAERLSIDREPDLPFLDIGDLSRQVRFAELKRLAEYSPVVAASHPIGNQMLL